MCCNQSTTGCGKRSACDLFLNHEERLKRVECCISYFNSAMDQLRALIANLQVQLDAVQQPMNAVRSSLVSLLNTIITIQTDAGSVTGELLFVGDDFVEIVESSGNLVFITLSSIIGF